MKTYLSLDSSNVTHFCLVWLYDECMSSSCLANVSFSSFFEANCSFKDLLSASNWLDLATNEKFG